MTKSFSSLTICLIISLASPLCVSALDLSNPFGKDKKEEAKETTKKETLKTLEPKLAEQEGKVNALKEAYAKKDPDAKDLLTKVKGYGTKLSEMNTEYGNVAGKLDTYLSGKYPKYKKASGSYGSLKKKYVSLKNTAKQEEPKKEEAAGLGGTLGNMAKSTIKDAGTDAAKEMEKKLEKKEAKLTEMQEELSGKTPEGKKLLADCAEAKSKIVAVEKEQKSADMNLTALLKKRYPDFKAVQNDYDVLKKKYDDLMTAKKKKAEK